MAARGRLSTGEKAFRMGNHFFLLLLAVFTLYPFWFIIQASFTDPIYRFSYLWPKGFYLACRNHRFFCCVHLCRC